MAMAPPAATAAGFDHVEAVAMAPPAAETCGFDHLGKIACWTHSNAVASPARTSLFAKNIIGRSHIHALNKHSAS